MDLSIEQWKPVIGYEGLYSVSSLGRVRSEARVVDSGQGWSQRIAGRIMKLRCPSPGYYWLVTLSSAGKQKSYTVHSLVARAFLGLQPPGHHILHGPAGSKCNALHNISYGTVSKNNGEDRVRDGTDIRGEQHNQAKLTAADVRFIRASSEGSRALGHKFEVSHRAIHKARIRETWAHIT